MTLFWWQNSLVTFWKQPVCHSGTAGWGWWKSLSIWKNVPNAILLYIFESWLMFEMIFLNLALNKKQILAENLLGNHNVPEWRNTLFWMWSAQIIIKLDVQCSFYNLLMYFLDFKKIFCIRESMLSGQYNIQNLVLEWRLRFLKGCTVKQDILLL